MTEPIDGPEMASDQGPTEPAAEVVGEVQPATEEPVPPQGAVPPEAPTTEWVAPEATGGGRWTRGCLVVVIVAATVLIVGFAGLVFIGGQVQSILAGTIEFGTGGTGCSVTGTSTTFKASSPIHSAAYLQREIRAGETITTVVTFPNGTSEPSDRTFDDTGKCITEDVEPGLDPGHYGLEYRAGTEVLAKGGFDVTP
jgi:hypothetical protein